jgi:hypothetical protein
MSRPTASFDDELPPDLQRLRGRLIDTERRPGERSVLEIMQELGWARTRVQKLLDDEVRAGRWSKREGYPSGRRGYWYREVASDAKPVHQAKADSGVHERTGRGGVFTDWRASDRGGRRAGGSGKARQARGK